jgi:hypothetical protein
MNRFYGWHHRKEYAPAARFAIAQSDYPAIGSVRRGWGTFYCEDTQAITRSLINWQIAGACVSRPEALQ